MDTGHSYGQEGDTNSTARRGGWLARHVDAATQSLLDRDAAVFLHQSLSTPCLSAIRKAEGLWIEDLSGRRYMDFHGNSAHHIGYGHPRLIEAVTRQMRAVPYIAPPGFWRKVRQACDEFGALLIFDEIPTGLGKTGRMFACEHEGVSPDILVLGKSLGGGMLPISAVIARSALDVCGDYAFGHYTHEKNPVTARAALTTLEIIEDEGLVENAAVVGQAAIRRLNEMKEAHALIGDVRGRGCLLGVELVNDRDSREPACDAAEQVLYLALERGLSFKISMGNVLTLSPPLIVTAAQMQKALDIVEECLALVEQHHVGASSQIC